MKKDLLLETGNLQEIQYKYFKAIKHNLLLIVNFHSDICSQKVSINEAQQQIFEDFRNIIRAKKQSNDDKKKGRIFKSIDFLKFL